MESRARDLTESGEFAAAADAWTALALESSGETAALYLVEAASCKLSLGMPRGALKDCEAAIKACPSTAARAHDLKGRALDAMGKARKAGRRKSSQKIGLEEKQIATSVLSAAASRAAGRRELDEAIAVGYLMVNSGRLGEAVRIFDEVLAARPETARARLGRGSARALAGDLEGAVADFDVAIEASPESADGWKRRGQTRVALGDAVGAVGDFDRAIELDAADADLRLQRGLAFHQLGDYRAAKRELVASGSADDRAATTWNVLGLCEAQTGAVDAALRCFERAVGVDPRCKEAWLNMGQTQRDAGLSESAFRSLDEALGIDGGYAAAHSAKGRLSYDLGNYAAAKRNFEAAGAHRYSGLCSHALWDFASAVACYDRDGCFYEREMAIYLHDRLWLPPEASDADRRLDPRLKEGQCKCLPPTRPKTPYSVVARNNNRLLSGDRAPAIDAWLARLERLEEWIQLDCPGFSRNKRHHRAFGLAALHVASLANAAWGKAKRVVVVEWRDLYEAAARWRREADPRDAVWWIDRLTPEAFSEGFGLQTPMVAGQLEVLRYPYWRRALQVVKAHLDPSSSTADLDNCRSLDDLYDLCGRRDFWVVAPCASLASPGLVLEGTRVTLQRRDPNGFDFTIRTPGTPRRWKLYDAEMDAAWSSTTRRAVESRRHKGGRQIRRLAVDATLVLFYYWVNFGPLTRGTAACGYAVLAGLLLALGFRPPLPPLPRHFQLDWEAILSPAPDDFLRDATTWLTDALHDVTTHDLGDGFLDDLPDPATAFPTLAARLQALASHH
ncbi:hypothetical protein CTAYLR_007093 [Chrysophaeum taylorii]|uniref:Tetratricopeptide repeat protein n=1 Tax=Chrysophaeum taylorii TaxID=2483200 RepID=A0AAD7XQ35_9STRA|nr:hypothetical protein CTAYLR_007093 [Chrysophaeum taylorii]